MPNPIVEQMVRVSGNPQQLQSQQQQILNSKQFQTAKRLYKIAQASNDPAATMQSLMASNPQIQQVINLINNSGLNWQQFYLNLAKQRGVLDPDNFIKELQK